MGAQYTGGQIAAARKAAGLTQKQLAETLHVTDKAVSKWERGLNYPDIALLQPLSAALGIPMASLICEGEPTAEQALRATGEMALEEKARLKRDLKNRWLMALFILPLIVASQVYLSHQLFYVVGVKGGMLQGIIGFTYGMAGILIGDTIRSLLALRKL